MNKQPVCIVISEQETSLSEGVWGTGGWIPFEQREGLDWLTLVKFMGWDVDIEILPQIKEDTERFNNKYSIIILACSAKEINGMFAEKLRNLMETESTIIICRMTDGEHTLFGSLSIRINQDRNQGKEFVWCGPGPKRKWLCRKPISLATLASINDSTIWAETLGQPIITSVKYAKGNLVMLSFHPSEARDQEGAITSLLKHLLVWCFENRRQIIDWTGSMILRMDDPGAAQNVYFSEWTHKKLNKDQWNLIAQELKQRNGKMSVGYVSGFIDDGDEKRGLLKIKGSPVIRVPGKIYPSPLVQYQDLEGHIPGAVYDFKEEYDCLLKLQNENLIGIELHGYTHMNPDAQTWALAEDRYDSVDWYRELGVSGQKVISSKPLSEHPLNLGIQAIMKYFHVYPTALIFPGDHWTNEALKQALKLRIHLICSYYQAIRYKEMYCWTYHVCAPYFDEPDSRWFDSELPVIGYMHDRDIAVNGVEWFSSNLEKWKKCGVREFIDLKEMANRLKLFE